MQKWQVFTILAMICAGIYPILHSKSVQIHGPMTQLIAVTSVFAVFSIGWLIFHPQTLSSITKESYILVMFAGMASICASLLLLNAYKLAPNKLSEIMITMGFSMVIVALIEHLRGNKMEPHQWLGALISILGISLVHLKK